MRRSPLPPPCSYSCTSSASHNPWLWSPARLSSLTTYRRMIFVRATCPGNICPGPIFFLTKNLFIPKTIVDLIVLNLNPFLTQKFLSLTFLTKIFLDQIILFGSNFPDLIFGFKIIWDFYSFVLILLDPKILNWNLLDSILFLDPKYVLTQKKIWTQNMFGLKKFMTNNFYS